MTTPPERFMLDALDVTRLPKDIPLTTILASYVDHPEYNPEPFTLLQRLYPNHRHVSISAHGTAAQVIDVETGANSPYDAPRLITLARAAGFTPWVYATVYNWSSVQYWCHAAKLALPLWWKADWSDGPDIPPTAIGTQYATNADYDTSVLRGYIPGFDPPPVIDPPTPNDDQEIDMATSLLPVVLLNAATGGQQALLRWPDGSYEIVRDSQTAHAFISAGSPQVSIGPDDITTRTNAAHI